MIELFDQLDDWAREDNFEKVEEAALDALDTAEDEDVPALWAYVAWARFEQGEYRSSLDAARFADDPLYEAKAYFHLWEFAEAGEALARFEGGGHDLAEAEWYRALLAEFTGGDPQPHYERAERLSPDCFPAPVRLSDDEVDAVIHDALLALPPPIAAAVEDTVITVARLPRSHPDVDPLTLGLYVGRDRMSRSVHDAPELPATIEIFRSNIERLAADGEEAAEELRITLQHEIAHHLGFDEDGVGHLGLQ